MDNNNRIPVTLCTGTTCYILGGSRYLGLADELPPEVLERIEIQGAPCMGRCQEPTGQKKMPCLTIAGQSYQGLSLEEAVRVIAEHAAVPLA